MENRNRIVQPATVVSFLLKIYIICPTPANENESNWPKISNKILLHVLL